MSPLIKDWGIGVGLRPAHYLKFLNESPKSVQWIEVISENYMPWTGKDFGSSIETLCKVRENYPVALHGVSMNLGSADPLDLDYMKRLKKLIDRTNPFVFLIIYLGQGAMVKICMIFCLFHTLKKLWKLSPEKLIKRRIS